MLSGKMRRLRSGTKEVSVVNQTFNRHRLFAQCPANNTLPQTHFLRITYPPKSSLHEYSSKNSPRLMGTSVRSESPMRSIACLVDSRSDEEPLFPVNLNAPYNPAHNNLDEGATRLLIFGFMLYSFGVLFGVALVIKRALKPGVSRADITGICVCSTDF